MCVRIGTKEKHQNGSVDDDKLIKFHKIQWDQLSIDILSQYSQTTDSLLGDIELPEDIVCRIKTGSGGVCCHNARGRVRNRKSNPDGVAGGI